MASTRIGIVGLGQRGLQHLKTLWHIEDAQIVALCDPFADNLEESKIRSFVADDFSLDGVDTFTRFSDQMGSNLLGSNLLDALYFCIPPGRHDGEILKAARAGVHIFAEKPVSLFQDEALAMDAAIRQAGVISTVGFQQRHDISNIAVEQFLRDKNLVMATSVGNGSLESHSVKHTHTEVLGGPAGRVWAANFAWSGSTVVESGIHTLDLMRFWAGDVAWTRADYVPRQADDIEDGGDNPDGYSVAFGMESGMVFNLLLTRLRKTFYSDGYMDIAWNRGHLKFEPEGPVAYYYDGPYPPESKPSADSLRHPLSLPEGENSMTAISRAFVRAVAENDDSHLLNTFSSSMNSLAAVLAANASDQLGGEKVVLNEFLQSERYATFRRKPTAATAPGN